MDKSFIQKSKFCKTSFAKGENGNEIVIKQSKYSGNVIPYWLKNELLSHERLGPLSQYLRHYVKQNQVFLEKIKLPGKRIDELHFSIFNRLKSVYVKQDIALKLLTELDKIHACRLLHLDLKPSNILYDEAKGEVHIIDFGQCADADMPVIERPFSLIYSAPECVLRQNDLIDQRTDLYMAALCIYQLFGDEIPFMHENPEMIMNMQINLPLPETNGISTELLKVLNNATFKIRLPLPPTLLSETEIHRYVADGIKGRYANAMAFANALANAF